jgi:dCTP deaminase
MSFWSSQSLRSRLPTLIEPFDDARIESASYELCLGDEIYISALPDTPHKDRKKIFLKEKETVAIPPGQFAFLITQEKVSVPTNAIALISMKFSPKAKGLVNVSGFHVDPGYTGRLIFAVYNAGPLNFHIQYGEQLFAIWFADLDDVDERPRTEPGFYSVNPSFMNSPDAMSSLPSLVKRLDDIDKKLENYTIRQGIAWSVIFALSMAFVMAFLKPAIDRVANGLLGLDNNKSNFVQPSPANQPASNPTKQAP